MYIFNFKKVTEFIREYKSGCGVYLCVLFLSKSKEVYPLKCVITLRFFLILIKRERLIFFEGVPLCRKWACEKSKKVKVLL